MAYLKMSDVNLTNKRVLIREDLNIPLKNGKITSDVRIKAAIPTIKTALDAGAKVIILSHLGRPIEGTYDPQFSLEPVAEALSQLLGQTVPLVKNWLDGVEVKKGQAVLCENVRFNVGEKSNDETLSHKIADLCDVYINDAFATAHRKEASTYGVALYAKIACAGLLMDRELSALSNVMENPEHPLVAIVGGSKVSTKLALLQSIIKKVDYLIIGGGIANTFIAASGYSIGNSLYEPDLIDEAEQLTELAASTGAQIPLPIDVIVAEKFSEHADAYDQSISQIGDDEKVLDIGPETQEIYTSIIKKAKTILWNGPVGAFEAEPFSKGTEAIAKAIAKSKAYSVAGGGDTIVAIEKYGVSDKISYISTGGGAFLSFLEGKTLPAIEALEQSYEKAKKQ
ncbi:MAG: phosphoglycerate kinase [Pseudomonadota bacterium]|nr:phosphoglycerate kinase [Gammaproteobacteria bacterium]MBU1558268.1 phosphoglycerate kinase [Gammaproteobacteria bacterium]MBU1628489.1 phosphoglycerate kinase [Gammaproteobacteria bacterium]MBU2546688.1 phosphoglycerate kinase [Gammaproteobacteria bacterium]